MNEHIFQQIQSIATVAGVVAATVGLYYTGSQVRKTKQIAQGDFLLRLDEHFQRPEHKLVHVNLRPGGVWSYGKGPSSNEDWVAVEAYMGLFERIKVLIDHSILDIKIIDRMYGYRVLNILSNPVIFKVKLVDEGASWKDFITLSNLIEKRRESNQS